MTSDQRASSLLLVLHLLLPCHRLDLLGQDGLHRLIEHVLQSFLGQSTALDILAAQLLLDDLSSILPRDRCILGILSLHGILLSLIDFVADKDLRHIPNNILQLWVPLHIILFTFLTALVKEAGSTTEKMIRKTSALGQASGLKRLYSSWPAVSHNPKLIILLSTLTVAVQLSKTVGTYSLGNLFCVQLGQREGYLIRTQVLPTAPSPTTTNFIEIGYSVIKQSIISCRALGFVRIGNSEVYSIYHFGVGRDRRAKARALAAWSCYLECWLIRFTFWMKAQTYSWRMLGLQRQKLQSGQSWITCCLQSVLMTPRQKARMARTKDKQDHMKKVCRSFLVSALRQSFRNLLNLSSSMLSTDSR